MWPPLLHVTLGVAMLLPFPPNTLALLLMAVFIAWIAFRSYQITADEFGPWAGAAVALVMVGLEAMQDAATAVMADILVAVMAWHFFNSPSVSSPVKLTVDSWTNRWP